MASPQRRAARVFAAVVLLASLGACSAEPEPPTRAATLARIDSALAELGGEQTADLERGQRWRMVSSIGTGLPPLSFRAEDLPEPESRGAGLLQVYCVQCHGVPAPQMHVAEEWPILVRRMLMRARTLHDRMGGPLTTGLVGEILMEGMRTTDVPSPGDVDTLVGYLQRHALEGAEPGELADGPDARLFIEQCSICHETPSPAAYAPTEWEPVVARMQANAAEMDVPALDDPEAERIVAFLERR